MCSTPALTVAVPTYCREWVLVETIHHLLRVKPAAAEILILDQTKEHEPVTTKALADWDLDGSIRWLRLPEPSIPKAMNSGLLEAQNPIVLFLDDDIIPAPELFATHLAAQEKYGLVAGQVLQPGEHASALLPGESFRFNATEPASIGEFMGGNFSIKTLRALELGGFDENFIGAAYRFEAEFAHRYTSRFGAIRFEPAARIDHLQASVGGTRMHGHHLTTSRPSHSVGDYYFLLRARPKNWLWRFLLRPLRAIRTKHHLTQPWFVFVTLIAEMRGVLLALKLASRGPKYVAR